MSRDPREVIRDEPLMRRPLLAAGSRTVPELAAALGAPPEEVMAWVMGLRKYGPTRRWWTAQQPTSSRALDGYRAVIRTPVAVRVPSVM